MTKPLTVDAPLGDIVAERPDAARVLDRFRLDYCCHGDRSLADACAAQGVEAGDVLEQLAETAVVTGEGWTALAPAELADHIVETHHVYLHEELPLLEELAAKVDTVHSERHPELREVHRLVAELRADLEPHLATEEEELFPAIRAAFSPEDQAQPALAVVGDAVAVMETDHDRAGELLEALRRVSADYVVPADGCNSYRSLYERLEALEADLHVHVHKENHTLFPAARLRLAASADAVADRAGTTGGN